MKAHRNLKKVVQKIKIFDDGIPCLALGGYKRFFVSKPCYKITLKIIEQLLDWINMNI